MGNFEEFCEKKNLNEFLRTGEILRAISTEISGTILEEVNGKFLRETPGISEVVF